MNRSALLVILFGLLVLAYLGWKALTDGAPFAEGAQGTEVRPQAEGQRLYAEHCAACHSAGSDEARPGEDLMATFTGGTDEFNAVLNNPPSPMPVFADELTAMERARLWDYLSRLRS